MGIKCLKCGYERKPSDSAPEYECPQCGAIYAKVEALRKPKTTLNHQEKHQNSYSGTSGFSMGNFVKGGLFLGVLGLLWIGLGRDNTSSEVIEKNASSGKVSESTREQPSGLANKDNLCVRHRYPIKPGESKTVSLEFPLFNTLSLKDTHELDYWKQEIIHISSNGNRVSQQEEKDWQIYSESFSTQPFAYSAWAIQLPADSRRGSYHSGSRAQCNIKGDISGVGLIEINLRGEGGVLPLNVTGALKKDDVVKVLRKCISETRKPELYSLIDSISSVQMEGMIVKINMTVSLPKSFSRQGVGGESQFLRIIDKDDKNEYPKPIGPFSIPIKLNHNNSNYEIVVTAFSSQCSNQPSPL